MKQTTKNLKKQVVTGTLVLAMLVTFVGCTNKSQNEPSDAIKLYSPNRSAEEIVNVGKIKAYADCWQGNPIEEDLSNNLTLAYSLSVSNVTKFASDKYIPKGYSVDKMIEWGKTPSLGMDILHKNGFTGKGATIAYVDQPIGTHEQYTRNNLHYTNNTESESSMHGPAVLSILAGKDIGVVPDADVYYYAHASWKRDQSTHVQCLNQIMEQNKKLPKEKKITMVGFSDNINPTEKNAEAFQEAVDACEKAGIMVWFCGDYGRLDFVPLSDKSNPNNVYAKVLGGYDTNRVFVPTSGVTTAANLYGANYTYWGQGGLSWAMPYVLGIYAMAKEIDQSLTKDELYQYLLDTSYKMNTISVIHPVAYIAKVLEKVGRKEDAAKLLEQEKNRKKYIYAVHDLKGSSQEEQQKIYDSCYDVTNAYVVTVDASAFSNTKEMYDALCADAKKRGGAVKEMRLYGKASMITYLDKKSKWPVVHMNEKNNE